MLNKIIKFSLENRLLVVFGSVLLLLSGGYVTSRMEVDIFPELTAPTVVVMTEAHGMAPEEVEKLVTFPIETSVNGATDIRRVRSSSSMGFSIVWVEFDWGTDIYNARQTVTERLVAVKDQLPTQAGDPFIAPQSSLLGEIMLVAITSDTKSPMELRTIAEWNLRPRLLSIGGVAQVSTIGGEFKEYQILVNPDLMKYYNVSFSEIIENSQLMNENATGGFIEQHGNQYMVRGIIRTNNTDELGNVVIKMAENYPVKISDVAKVKIGSSPKIGDASYRGEKAVILSITKQPNVNTIELTKSVNESLVDIQKNIGNEIHFHTDIYNQSEFINTSINNVKKALVEGSFFVIIILFLFLMNYRTTLISLLAIPLSLLVTILVLKALGLTINTMSLGGMAIAIGSLVDDAIIDVENVYKRLKQNVGFETTHREKPLKVIFDASTEIRPSIMNATIIIIVAFVPLFFLGGMEGRMLKPLGISYIVALFASLVVAITITPVLCSYLLTNEKRLKKHKKGSWLERKLNRLYFASLKWVLNKKTVVLSSAFALLILAVVVFTGFGSNFLPPFNEGSLTINLNSLPGISLEESYKLGKKADDILLDIPEIKSVARRTGRSELAEHSFGVNVSEIDAPFELIDRSRAEFLADVRSQLKTIKGATVEVGQPVTHRMDHMLSGTKANIAIKLFGNELNEMFQVANVIKSEIQDIEGIGDLFVEQQIEIPQLKIKPKRDMLAKYGIPLNKFMEFVDYAFAGEKVSDVFEDEKSFDLVLRFDEEHRNSIETIQEAMIDTHDGKKIPIYYVADITSSSGPNTISRENVQRKIVVSVNVADRDVGSVVKDIIERVNDHVILPEGYRVEYGGQFESAASASRTLTITSIIAILVIFLILFQEFKSTKLAWIILLNLPLAMIGGVIAIRLTSGVVSIPVIIGFITLFGIATRNGILLVSRYRNMAEKGIEVYDRVIRGSLDRLNPILMTALTAALALIPLAIAGDKPGNEIQSPMAVVILGGLLSSTFLNIYIVPVIYLIMHNKEVKDEK
ncbi:MAG: CusA/CzcA family heavy metal efflux RND transporter [Bacteroidales bacterium]|nr:CusA/CzcA family heavy metal efflux RND transporter [Bacteroidales bacterium]